MVALEVYRLTSLLVMALFSDVVCYSKLKYLNFFFNGLVSGSISTATPSDYVWGSSCGLHRQISNINVYMGWLRLVGSLKLQVSLENIGLFCRALLQKRPIILRSLLIVATPHHPCASRALISTCTIVFSSFLSRTLVICAWHTPSAMFTCTISYTYIRMLSYTYLVYDIYIACRV